MSTTRTLAGAVAIGAAVLATSACSITWDLDDEIGTRDVAVESFDAIDLNGSGDVFVTLGEAPSLRIEADTAILDDVRTSVKDDVLSLDGPDGFFPFWSTTVTYYVTVPTLEEFSINGSSDTEIRDMAGGDLRLTINGSADVTVTGTADSFSAEINGSGSIHGKDLDARDVSIDISGSGDADVNASDTLDVDISGSGDVRFGGAPTVTSAISGSGDVQARDN